MGNYYIKVYSVYNQKQEGNNVVQKKTLLVLAYFSCLSFSVAIRCAWIICWSYSKFSPQKVTIFEIFTCLTETNFPLQKIPLVGKNQFFLLFKGAQVFVFPLRAVLALVGLVFARKRATLLFNTPGIFLNLLASIMM